MKARKKNAQKWNKEKWEEMKERTRSRLYWGVGGGGDRLTWGKRCWHAAFAKMSAASGVDVLQGYFEDVKSEVSKQDPVVVGVAVAVIVILFTIGEF